MPPPRRKSRRCCRASLATATFAWVEDNGSWDAEGTALTATAESGQIVLSGHKSYVVDGHTADLIVVLARAPQGLSLFTVDGNAPGLTRRALKSMDTTRKFARIEFNPQARPHQLQPLGGPPAGYSRRRGGPIRAHDGRGRGLSGQRNGRWGRQAAGGCAGLCDDAHAVR